MNNFYNVIITIFTIIISMGMVQYDTQEQKQALQFPLDKLQQGDIAFRRGEGFISEVVVYNDAHGMYSHIGIIVKHNDSLKVVHAVPGEPDFKGYIHDVGGPTANFRQPSCKGQEKRGMCKGRKCLAPTPCKNLVVDHSEYLRILRKLRALPGVKKVFIRSGIRFDYLILDENEEFFKDLVRYHVSGQLKVAPEHCSNNVLNAMGKPNIEVYEKFRHRFYELTKSMNKKQYLVPYLMSSHPGSTPKDAIELALFLKKEGLHPEQVQDFYPTPGTISTCMFYTGLDPYTEKPIFVPKTREEKAEQRALLQYFRPENRQVVMAALRKAGRSDLIGYGENCLIKPDAPQKNTYGSPKGKPVMQSKKPTQTLGKRANIHPRPNAPKSTKSTPKKNRT